MAIAKHLPQKAKPDNRGCFAFEDEIDHPGRFNWNEWNPQFSGGYSFTNGKFWQRWAPVRDGVTHEIRGFIYSTGHWKTDTRHIEARVVWIGENTAEVLRA